jgi:protein-tyrosine phosphatase
LSFLEQEGITKIDKWINLSGKEFNPSNQLVSEYDDNNNDNTGVNINVVNLTHINIYDPLDIYFNFDALASDIHDDNKPQHILIHCRTGLNRSGFLFSLIINCIFNKTIESILKLFKERQYPGMCDRQYIVLIHIIAFMLRCERDKNEERNIFFPHHRINPFSNQPIEIVDDDEKILIDNSIDRYVLKTDGISSVVFVVNKESIILYLRGGNILIKNNIKNNKKNIKNITRVNVCIGEYDIMSDSLIIHSDKYVPSNSSLYEIIGFDGGIQIKTEYIFKSLAEAQTTYYNEEEENKKKNNAARFDGLIFFSSSMLNSSCFKWKASSHRSVDLQIKSIVHPKSSTQLLMTADNFVIGMKHMIPWQLEYDVHEFNTELAHKRVRIDKRQGNNKQIVDFAFNQSPNKSK